MQPQPAIINYQQFKATFDKEIFSDAKAKLIRNIAEHPERFVGLFRATLPETKLRQNLLQSHEIRFGNAFEKILLAYLAAAGWQPLDSALQSQDKDKLEPDILMQKQGQILFAEVKVRDDHDSTKKRGQINNFRQKVTALLQAYGPALQFGFFYFIDPNMVKNRNYYQDELNQFTQQLNQPSSPYPINQGLQLRVAYGPDFFYALGLAQLWIEIEQHLFVWRSQLPQEPDLNFDRDAAASAMELGSLPPRILIRLFTNPAIVEQILPVLFPHGATLQLLAQQLQHRTQTAQLQQILQLINEYLQRRSAVK